MEVLRDLEADYCDIDCSNAAGDIDSATTFNFSDPAATTSCTTEGFPAAQCTS